MSSRPLSVLIPSSWSQQKKRTPSIQSSSSSNAVHSPSWSTMSIDQLSLYARRASNSSLSMLAGNVEDKKKIRQADKLQQAMQGFSQILLMSLNDCSLGFYRISDHIHRKVPRIVETKRRLRQSSQKVQVAISDIEDVRKNVCDIERIEAFYNINKMIAKSIEIINKSKRKMIK
ncbi:uncharacterized protein EV154DRAFT_538127 [Mucor mucedo]|uniref:uncharacterized protein n=1 Tax=Mucor mucedo TaxID=29922 RepID=UPI0022209761|nr:uncharacterized protein EV154DRAFT_538127 [Mucor mucedo]KAI7891065.1 hypothetical protein EV154DRAFT_538127 [Mucor mucedo]